MTPTGRATGMEWRTGLDDWELELELTAQLEARNG